MTSRRLAITFVCLALLGGALLNLRHHQQRPALDRSTAIKLARGDSRVATSIADHPDTKVTVSRIDDDLTRVSFQQGPRTLVEAAVSTDGTVRDVQPFVDGGMVYGGSSPLANNVLLWIMLGGVFALTTLSRSLRSWRTVDVIALLGVMASVAMYNEAWISASTVVGYPVLAWLAARCLLVACDVTGPDPTPSLWSATWGRLRGSVSIGRVGWILLIFGLAINVLVAALPSVAIDVGYASMAGATALVNGDIPYGHLTSDIIHGDTYPPLAYLLYVPAALLWPVRDLFDPPTGALFMSALGTCVAVLALARFTGPRLAIAFAVHPLVVIGSASGSNDMVVAALLALAITTIARPATSALFVALAAWTKLAPIVVLPIWLSRGGWAMRGRVVAATALATAVAIIPLVAVGGRSALADMVDGVSFQASRGTLKSLWAQIDVPLAQHMAESFALLAVLSAPLLAHHLQRRGVVDVRRWAALCAALLLLAQIAARHWTPLYLVWALPFLLVALCMRSQRGDAHDVR